MVFWNVNISSCSLCDGCAEKVLICYYDFGMVVLKCYYDLPRFCNGCSDMLLLIFYEFVMVVINCYYDYLIFLLKFYEN